MSRDWRGEDGRQARQRTREKERAAQIRKEASKNKHSRVFRAITCPCSCHVPAVKGDLPPHPGAKCPCRLAVSVRRG